MVFNHVTLIPNHALFQRALFIPKNIPLQNLPASCSYLFLILTVYCVPIPGLPFYSQTHASFYAFSYPASPSPISLKSRCLFLYLWILSFCSYLPSLLSHDVSFSKVKSFTPICTWYFRLYRHISGSH